MTEICVKFDQNHCETYVIIIPYGNEVPYDEFIRRVHIKCIWRYSLFNEKEQKFIDTNDIISSKSSIIFVKNDINPMFFCKELYNVIDDIKEKNKYREKVDDILIWLNYDEYSFGLNPILLYFMAKKLGIWGFTSLRAKTFTEVKNAITENKYFTSIKYSLQRFQELNEEYNLM